jgi:mannose-6-phosphate isomerase-like protein (cupin superfamily)
MPTHSLHKDIALLARSNDWFRKEVVTGEHSQVMLMCVEPGHAIGEETHMVDQTLVFVAGSGEAILDGLVERFDEGDLFFVPAGTRHNFKNTGTDPLKLFTIYAPNEHVAGTNHRTQSDAEHDPNEQHH